MSRFRRSMEKTPEFQHGMRIGEKIARNKLRGWLLDRSSQIRKKEKSPELAAFVSDLAQEAFRPKP